MIATDKGRILGIALFFYSWEGGAKKKYVWGYGEFAVFAPALSQSRDLG
jgi:hypothetical protein